MLVAGLFHAPAPVVDTANLPSVLLLAPIRNEVEALPDLLVSLEKLRYPYERLTVVLINDGSTDNSQAIIDTWVAKAKNRHSFALAQNIGKAAALNEALQQFSQGMVVTIYDSDERPQPETLQVLVAPFADSQIGAVSGRRAVSNATASPAASYTTFEGLVHQLITIQAKDRLELAPAILGANCAYRRAALAEVGNFRPGALLEDSDLTLKLIRAGWHIRFLPQAVSYHQVPETVVGYWRQHTRWARGFNEVAREQGLSTLFEADLPLALRLELTTFALGYLDRLALVLALGLAVLKKWSHFPVWIIILNLLTPFIQIAVALKIERAPLQLWRQLVWVPVFFLLDIGMAVNGLWSTLKGKPKIWEERKKRK